MDRVGGDVRRDVEAGMECAHGRLDPARPGARFIQNSDIP